MADTQPVPEDVDWVALAPRARRLFYIRSILGLTFFWVPACFGISVGLAVFLPAWAAVAGAASIFFLLFLEAVWMPWLEYQRWGYALRPADLLVRRGVFFRRVTAIPTGRVQHVDTRQGPLEQWMQLVRLQVFTASGLGADAVIPGLDRKAADAIRDRLMDRVEKADDDGV